jgi:hypothetical protein
MVVEKDEGVQEVWTDILRELDSLSEGEEDMPREEVAGGGKGAREEMLKSIHELAQGVFSEIAVVPGSIEEAVAGAFATGDVSFNLDNANEWARD